MLESKGALWNSAPSLRTCPFICGIDTLSNQYRFGTLLKQSPRNYAQAMLACNFFVSITARFRIVYVFVIMEVGSQGIRIVMLAGDSGTTAKAVAKKLGIDDVIVEVLPEDKSKKVKDLQRDGRFVAMAGNGINDAPARAQAQVASQWVRARMLPWRAPV
jgi:hypothetical protein